MSDTTRTTIYLSPSVRRALKQRIIDSDLTMSEYVDRAVAQAIAEDLEDIEDIESRSGGETESFDDFMKALKQDGLV